MWLFMKNKGYNTNNYYKVEISESGSKTLLSIYDLIEGEVILKKTSDILKSEKEDFIEYLKQLLAEQFILINEKTKKKTVWINKSFIKMVEVKPMGNNKVVIAIEAVQGYSETIDVAESYPEFNLFWFKNWKSNIPDDTVVFVPSSESAKRGKKSKVENVVNMI